MTVSLYPTHGLQRTRERFCPPPRLTRNILAVPYARWLVKKLHQIIGVKTDVCLRCAL